MANSLYVQKLRAILEKLRADHETLVNAWPGDSPRHAINQIIDSYKDIEALEAMIKAEADR